MMLLKAILAPHEYEAGARIVVTGQDTTVSSKALTSLALMLHELATNAAKYGALSTPDGILSINLSLVGELFRVDWDETSPPRSQKSPDREGFGTALEKAVLRGINGVIHRTWKADGLSLSLELPLASLRL